MDPVAVRRIALYIFSAIQVAKSVQLSHYLINQVPLDPLIPLWCLADLIFLIILKKYSKPRLTIIGVVILFVGMTTINAGIVGVLSADYDVEPIKETDSAVHQVDPLLDQLLNSSHIIGSHTIKVRPPTMAKLNPHDSKFCVGSGAGLNSIILPISIKGTPPFYVDYTVSGKEFKNITLENRNSIKYLPDQKERYQQDLEFVHEKETGRRLGLYSLQATSSGLYKITSLRDYNGDLARVHENTVNVVDCPEMEWRVEQRNIKKCVDEQLYAEIELRGVPPLSVLYIVQSANNERIETLESNSMQEIIRIPVTQKVDVPEKMLFKLLRVTDGLNNSIEYSGQTDTLLPPTNPKATNLVTEKSDVWSVEGHSPPIASLSNINDVKIRTVYDSQYQHAPSVSVDVVLNGAAPFSLDYEFLPTDGSPAQPQSMRDMMESRTHLTTVEPGQFRLLSVSDRFCKGSIKLPSTCEIQPVFPPAFEFTTSPIEESCFGAVGTNVDLIFTGEAPYWVEYVLERRALDDSGAVQRYPREREVFSKHRSLLVLKPKQPGKYRYIFERVGDKNYNDGIPLSESSLNQIIHPHSSAFFIFSKGASPPYKFVKCKGDKLKLRVGVEGSGPWEVLYEISHTVTKRFTRSIDASSKGFEIEIDNLDVAGVYTVDLVEIKDGNGCNVRLSTESVLIEVLQNRPAVSFSSSRPIWILDGGSAHLPISLSGRGPFKVGIKLPDGQQREITLGGSSRSIEVSGTGDFELYSVSDSVCQGSVDTKQIMTVLAFKKPSMSIAGTSDIDRYNSDVCVDSQVAFQVDLVGKAPFKVFYSHNIKYLDDSAKDTNRELTEVVDTFYLKLMMDTSKPGIHTFKFFGLSDDNYKNHIKLKRPLSFTQKVNPAPTASFIEPPQKVFHCSTKNAPPYQLMMNLVGKPPFNVIIEQKLDNQHVNNIQVNNISSDELKKNRDGSYIWKPETKSINMMGKHEFILQSLSDQSGCSSSFEGSDVSTFLEIADQARITTLNPPDICIGDLLSYSLQGTPPFTIGYTWKGVPQPEITVADPLLSFWAGAAGKLSITKVCNSADCCDENVASDSGLSSYVHDLPKAIVGDGDDSFDDIREGDESSFSIDFQGEPPFSFTYARSRAGASALKEELFTVSEIDSKHWSINTSQEGTFRVTSVQDKFCSYPRRLASTGGVNHILT